MARTEQDNLIALIHAHPVHLFVGSAEITEQKTIALLQQLLCKQHGCDQCVTCQQIRSKQHHACMWIAPEKGYTTEDLEDLFHQASFAQEANDYFFFILQKIETVSASCANSLLKLLEEPPAGYRFILHTYHSNSVPATVRSRSIVTNVEHTHAHEHTHPLYRLFTQLDRADLAEFTDLFSSNPVSEHVTAQLLDALISFWTDQLKDEYARKHPSKGAAIVIQHLTHALQRLPMPGSSKLFWHNLYLQCLLSLGR